MNQDDHPPLLSIVTVVKDDPNGLRQTLDSTVTHLDDRVRMTIIDGSQDPDQVTRIVGDFDSTVVDTYWSKPAGVYPAMNVGLSRATGDYVLFLNAGDDLHEPSALDGLLTLLEQGSPEWLVARVAFDDGLGSIVIPPQMDYDAEQRAHFARGVFPAHQGTVVRRQALVDLGGFDESYAVTADYKVALLLSTQTRPVLTDIVLATFHTGGLSEAQWRKSLREFRRARREVFNLRGWVRVADDARSGVLFLRMLTVRGLRRIRRRSSP